VCPDGSPVRGRSPPKRPKRSERAGIRRSLSRLKLFCRFERWWFEGRLLATFYPCYRLIGYVRSSRIRFAAKVPLARMNL